MVEKGVIRVPYNTLFNTIGACLVDDRSTLLLYSLIHGNAYFLVRRNPTARVDSDRP